MAFEGGGRGRQIRIIYQIKHILINHICTHINFYWNYITLFTISKNKKNQYLDQSLVSAKFLLGHKNIQEIRIDPVSYIHNRHGFFFYNFIQVFIIFVRFNQGCQSESESEIRNPTIRGISD